MSQSVSHIAGTAVVSPIHCKAVGEHDINLTSCAVAVCQLLQFYLTYTGRKPKLLGRAFDPAHLLNTALYCAFGGH